MAIVGNVLWDCPGCNFKNIAQVHDSTMSTYHYGYVPYGMYLSWSPPCGKCGKYKLKEPDHHVSFVIKNIEE